MHVIKRNGKKEDVSFDKIAIRIRNLCALPKDMEILKIVRPEEYQTNLCLSQLEINHTEIAQKVIGGLYDGVTTVELDNLAANIAASLGPKHPNYMKLAARLEISNHQKNVKQKVQEYFNNMSSKPTLENIANILYNNIDVNGNQTPLVSPRYYAFVKKFSNILENMINYNNDYKYGYNGFNLLKESYLFSHRTLGPMEFPQHMLMRIAIAIHSSKPVGKKASFKLHDNTTIRDIIVDSFSDVIPLKKINKYYELIERNKFTWDGFVNKFFYKPEIRSTVRNIINNNIISWDTMLQNEILDLDSLNMIEIDSILENIRINYELFSEHLLTQATPTLLNAGSLNQQFASCFLISVNGDDLPSIADFWKECALISKRAGGIGSCLHNIRATNAYIRSTNGTSNGLPPMVRVINKISSYVDQGGNKRPGSNAVYLTTEHKDVMQVLSMKRPIGNENEAARELTYAIWFSDEFIRTIRYEYELRKIGDFTPMWTLLSEDEANDLSLYYDAKFSDTYLSDSDLNMEDYAFTTMYRKYSKTCKNISKVSALDMWMEILGIAIETGVPYMVSKDNVNRKSNYMHYMTVQISNLCGEIVQPCNTNETAACNLASICINKFAAKHNLIDETVNEQNSLSDIINWELLRKVVHTIVVNINKIIDVNHYPSSKAKRSNLKHRPMGIGIQGLADLFASLKMCFGSKSAIDLDKLIHEHIYYYALEKSCELAKLEGPYETYQGSPASQGLLQYDLFSLENNRTITTTMDWVSLKANIKQYGLRNSMFVALMPTASTSTIMSNSPCFEPFNGLIHKRKNKLGEITMINENCINELIRLGLWNNSVYQKILGNKYGGLGDTNIPIEIKQIYKTAFEVGPDAIILHAVARAPFVDQSQSMNLFIERPTKNILNKIYFNSWKSGLKTCSYYIRQLAAADAQKLQITTEVEACPIDCRNCGS